MMSLQRAWKYPWRCGCVVLAIACVTLAPAARADPVRVQAAGESADAGATRSRVPTGICFDTVFYGALPGRTNYCLGLRAWKHGHYANGLVLLKLAAGWGNKSAQYTLGLIYYNGHHAPANPALGIAWLKLADERHDDAGIARAARAAARWATPAERARADELFTNMRATYGDEVAAARAWHHLQHWKMSHGPFSSGCVMLYPRQAYYLVRMRAQLARPSVSKGKGGQRVWHGGACFSMQQARRVVTRAADVYFEGWMGTVTVEPLEQVPAPAASSSH